MAKNGFVIDNDRRILTVGSKQIRIRAKGYDEPITAYSMAKIEFPAYSRKIIWLKSTIPGPIIVETNKFCDVGIAEGLHECGSDENVAVTLINRLGKPISICAGSEICDITKVDVRGYLVNKALGKSEVINSISIDSDPTSNDKVKQSMTLDGDDEYKPS